MFICLYPKLADVFVTIHRPVVREQDEAEKTLSLIMDLIKLSKANPSVSCVFCLAQLIAV